jgi:hypothetical protein
LTLQEVTFGRGQSHDCLSARSPASVPAKN